MKFCINLWILLISVCMFMHLSSCLGENTDILRQQRCQKFLRVIRRATPMIHSGDIIMRTGSDITSYNLRKLNRHDQTYSHCGIACVERDTVFVYHAIGGESNPEEKIKRETLAAYANWENNEGLGIYRWNTATKAQTLRILDTVRYWWRKGIRFDMSFDLSTDDKMYCTEFVAKAVARGMNGKTVFSTERIAGRTYIAPDDIFLYPGMQRIARFTY